MDGERLLDWEQFEDEVFERASRLVRVYLHTNRVDAYRKKRYYSARRQGDITFEIAFEVSRKGHSAPWLTWVWECKDYPNDLVDVNEIEVFADQMNQVGIVKGTVVTRKGFTKKATNYARSHCIGLAVLQKKLIPITCFDAEPPRYSTVKLVFSTPYLATSAGTEYGANDDWDLDAFVQMELSRWGAISIF